MQVCVGPTQLTEVSTDKAYDEINKRLSIWLHHSRIQRLAIMLKVLFHTGNKLKKLKEWSGLKQP